MISVKDSVQNIRSIFAGIKFPQGLDFFLLFGFILVSALFNAFKLCGDCFYGYSITEYILHPTWYHISDLVVNGGASNFLFYRLMAYFPFFRDNFVLRDFIISVPLTFLIVLAWYNVFYELTRNRTLVLLSIFFLIFSDDKLNLNGYSIPFFTLTSIGSIHFLQIFALFFFLQSKYLLSLILLALTAYIHPGSSLTYLIILGLVLLFKAVKEKNFKIFIKPIIYSVLIIIPNLIIIKRSMSATNFQAGEFFNIFYTLMVKLGTGHSYLETYFSRGYLYFLALLLLLVLNQFKKIVRIEHQNEILSFIFFSVAGSLFWLANLYFIHNLSVFQLFFVAKAFLLVKPVLILFVVLVFDNLFKRDLFAKLIAVLLCVALFTFSSWQGAVVLLVVSVYYLIEPKFKTIVPVNLLSQSKLLTPSRIYMFTVGVVLLVGVLTFGYKFNNKLSKIYGLLRGRNQFNFSFDKSKNYIYAKASPAYSDLVDWAKQYKGKMFIVPVFDDNFSVSFRYLTKDSIYISVFDTGQLSYNPDIFIKAYKRMLDVGILVTNSAGYNVSGYNMLTMEQVKKLDVDFIVFDKISLGYNRSILIAPSFENDKYIVYKIR